MTSVGKNVNSYDAGGKPFQHDKERGKWKSISDFYLGCIGNAFNIKCFTLLPYFIESSGGVFFIIPFTIGLILFSFPIFIFQSFLGQFSSTGFISVYRISPLFKGIGYITLILNISSICYYSAIVAYPLIYFLVSFNPSLPWMSCNNSFNTVNCTLKASANTNDSDTPYYYYYYTSWNTLEFFAYGIANLDENEKYQNQVTKLAWPIFLGTILIWAIMAGIFSKGFEMVSLAIRLCASISLILFGIFFIRIICLPGAMQAIISFFSPYTHEFMYYHSLVTTPFATIFIFGSGWGTIQTMASYNNFKADVIQYTKFIGFGLMIIFLLCTLTMSIIEYYLEEYLKFAYYSNDDYLVEYVLVGVPYLLGHFEAANMWSMIFFGMLFLCELCGLIVQMLAIQTAIFDEFENLRSEKRRVTLLIISCIGLASLFFTTNKELFYFNILVSFSTATQMGLCFIELIIVVWFYGRERFQRDIQFMLGRTFATWKFYIIRFVTPLFIIILLILFTIASTVSVIFYSMSIFDIFLIIVVKILPWICLPAYIGIKLTNTTGTLYHRFKKCIWPNDWYPVDPIYRQRYEETLGTSDISHQLITMKPDDEECGEYVK